MAQWRQGLVKLIQDGYATGGVKVWCHERGTYVIVPVVAVEERLVKMKESGVANATEQEVSKKTYEKSYRIMFTRLDCIADLTRHSTCTTCEKVYKTALGEDRVADWIAPNAKEQRAYIERLNTEYGD